jgi:hypothetical protein
MSLVILYFENYFDFDAYHLNCTTGKFAPVSRSPSPHVRGFGINASF